MTNEVKNVPEIRFPEFSGEWEENKLNNYLKTSKIKNTQKKYNKQDVLSVSGYFGIVNQIEFQGRSFAGASVASYGIVETGDIVYTKSPLKSSPYGIIKVNKGESGIVSTLYAIYKPLQNVDANFVENYFTNDLRLNKYLKPLVNKGAKNDMKVSDDNALIGDVIFPKYIEEQIKISKFFSKLDRQIELEEEKLELLEQQKKGYMQKIFSRELRFKDDNGNNYPDWEMKKLGNIANIVGGGTPSTKKSEYWDGNINWFSPVEIGDKEFVSTSQRRITEKGLEKSSAKMLPIGTVLFTSRAGIGKTAILSKEATTNQGFQSIVPKENDLDSYFLYSMTSILKRNAEKVGAGSTFSEVSRKQMEQIKLLIPILKEQKQIGRLFQIINRKINKQLHKIELLKQRKKGLLQKMFV